MKLKLCYLVILTSTLLFQSCGGGLANGPKDTNDMKPVAGTEDTSARPRPPENAAVITTDEHYLYDVSKKTIFLRGINLDYGANPATRIEGIPAIKLAGSNVVQLLINENTTDTQLEGALSVAVSQGMISVISFTDSTGKLLGSEDGQYLLNIVDTLWLKKWAPVIAQDRFQANIMINIASGWGPSDIFNPDSLGYQTYLDTYKALIRKFRTAGWKVPIIIDAPSGGQDFNAFLNGRSRELMAADSAKNLVLGVHIDGPKWNTSDKVFNAATQLYNEKLPFIATALTGSGVAAEGEAPVDHLDVLAKSAGDPALNLTLPWTTATDAVGYVVNLDSALDLRGGAILSTQVFLDKIYAEFELNNSGNYEQKGKLKFQMYIKDANGNGLKLGATTASDVRSNQWNKLSFDLPKSNEDIVADNLMSGATSFDLSAVKGVGIEIIANGKSPSLKANIKLDDLNILPGVPPLRVYNFNENTEGWVGMWGKTQQVSQSNGALSLLTQGGELVIGPDINDGINFSKSLLFTFRMKIPADYDIPWAGGQIFAKFGENYQWVSTSFDIGSLKKGEWIDWKVNVDFRETAALGAVKEFGFQIWNLPGAPSSPILIDSIVVTDVNAKPTKTVTSTQYKATFTKGTEGFVNVGWDNGKGVVTMAEGALTVTLPEGDVGAVSKEDVSSIPEIDFKGNSKVKMKIFVPADWANKTYKIKFFFQDGSWKHYEYASVESTEFAPGEWKEFEFPLDNFPDYFSRTLSPKRFGFQFGGVPAGTIKFDDIEIIGDTQVDDSQPVYTLDFSSQEDLGVVKFDFGAGSFTESALEGAKSFEWKVVPFGWTATSWKGNIGANVDLDISKAESIVDLTARGEDIVNSMFGIKATSIPATVSAPAVK